MSSFWADPTHALCLRSCLRCILDETLSLSNGSSQRITLFVAIVTPHGGESSNPTEGNASKKKSLCMEVYDVGSKSNGTWTNRMRYSGLPVQPPTTAASQDGARDTDAGDDVLEYDELPPIKKNIVDVVGMMQSAANNDALLHRLIIQMERGRGFVFRVRNAFAKFHARGPPTSVKDQRGKRWDFGMLINSPMKNVIFESYVKWLEEGSEGRCPASGKWDGSWTLSMVPV